MTEETETTPAPAKNVHEAIINVMEQVGYVQKRKGKEQGIKYTYAGEAALIEALRPPMVAQGLFMYVTQVKQMLRSEYQTSSGTTMQNTVLTGIVRIHHAPSNTFIDVEAVGEGSDVGDKSSPKAMTGFFKYALRETFLIETGDDPDRDQNQEPRKQVGANGNNKGIVDPNLGPVTDAAWEMWTALAQKAQGLNVPFVQINRAGVNIGQLRKRYSDLEKAVEAITPSVPAQQSNPN